MATRNASATWKGNLRGGVVPNEAFALALLLAFGAGFSMIGAASAARSHDPFS